MTNKMCKQYLPILRPTNVWKLGNKNAKWQFYLERLTGGESEKLNGNVVTNPKNRYHWWHRKKRIMKENSSLIIVKKTYIQLRPRDYHQVLFMLGFRWRYAGEYWKRSFICTVRPTVKTALQTRWTSYQNMVRQNWKLSVFSYDSYINFFFLSWETFFWRSNFCILVKLQTLKGGFW